MSHLHQRNNMKKTSQPRSGNFLLEDLNSAAFSLISAQRLIASKSLWSK